MTQIQTSLPCSLLAAVSVMASACADHPDANRSPLASSDAGFELRMEVDAGGLPVSRPNESFELNHSTLTDRCAATATDTCERCEADQRVRVRECWSTCSDTASAHLFERCKELCRNTNSADRCEYACDAPNADECAARAYEFTISGEPNAHVDAACRRAVARDDECGETSVGTACEVVARVEKPEVSDVYDCVADVPCGKPVDSCLEALGASNFSKEIGALCEHEALRDELADLLDMLGTWLRRSALDDAAVCQRVCRTGDYNTCVEQWIDSMMGQ